MTTDEIVAAVKEKFPCFGGGDERVRDNPIAAALKDRPLMFAMGVDVKSVVEFVIDALTPPVRSGE
jgi:hypothetical protein